MTTKAPALPAALGDVRRQFERWRETRPPRARIPEPLWHRAAELAREYGLYRVMKELRLDYYALKERVEAAAASNPAAQTRSSGFVELIAPVNSATHLTECTIEIENRRGGKMRMHLRGAAIADLVELSRAFWGAQE